MLKCRLKNTKNGLLDSAMFYATNQQKIFLNVNLKNISYLSQQVYDAYETIFICFTSKLYNYVKNSQGFKIDNMTFGCSILWLAEFSAKSNDSCCRNLMNFYKSVERNVLSLAILSNTC